jgi:hypothetical protein
MSNNRISACSPRLNCNNPAVSMAALSSAARTLPFDGYGTARHLYPGHPAALDLVGDRLVAVPKRRVYAHVVSRPELVVLNS